MSESFKLKNANPGYVYKITYEENIVENAMGFLVCVTPIIKKLHADTLEPVIDNDRKI